MNVLILSTGLAGLLANIGLGGAIYEHGLIDPTWPKRPDIVQPRKGGISRARFWIPAHTVFEIGLLFALYLGWSDPEVRTALLVALVAHVLMRAWSAFDMIPKALAFEKAEAVEEADARDWTRRSLMRFPFALVTSLASMAAFAFACGHGV